MSKQRNAAIGECPCYAKDCDETAKVFRFKARGTDGTRNRFAGKLYATCASGHTFGTRGDSQDWILTKGTIWGSGKSSGAAPAAPAEKPQPVAQETPAKPAPAPVPPKGQTGSSVPPAPARAPVKSPAGWGFFGKGRA